MKKSKNYYFVWKKQALWTEQLLTEMLKHNKKLGILEVKIENFSNFPRWREERQLVLGNICNALLDGVGRVSRHLGIL